MRRATPACGWATVEFLIATLITLLMIAAGLQQLLALRGTQRRALVRSDNSQSARAALLLLRDSISTAGLAVRPRDGAQHPDEGLEGAWSAGLVVRGDTDRSTAEADSPERMLVGDAPFQAVTTGNDEIVGWFLGGADDASQSDEQVTFFADVQGIPRDALVEEITIDRIDLQQSTPPYTLYRIHVREDSTATTRRPVIDGVRRLSFEYFDEAGRLVVAPGGQDDAAGRAARDRIRSIAISLEIDGEPDAPRDSGEIPQQWRLVVAPRNLALPSRSDP